MPLQSRSALFQIHCNSPYKTETVSQKNSQFFNIRSLDFDFLESFLKYWINWVAVLFKLNVFRKCYSGFEKICRDLFPVVKYVNGNCFLSYSERRVLGSWSISFWEIYENKNCTFPLSPFLATFIMLLSIIHLNNGFSFDEASYSVIFQMWLERHLSLPCRKDAVCKDFFSRWTKNWTGVVCHFMIIVGNFFFNTIIQ